MKTNLNTTGTNCPALHRYRYPLRFYLLSTLIPWSLWFIAAYLSHQNNASDYGLHISLIGLLGLSGPLFIVYFLIRDDKALLRDVVSRLLNWRSGQLLYLLTALVLMPASILLAMAISLFFGYDIAQFSIPGHATFSSGVFPVWFLLVIAPIIEELAWHSYGTDCLRQKFNLFNTSMIFAIYWALWHLPLASINGYYHSNLMMEGVWHSLNFLVSIFPFVLLMNWLYYKTGRNILVAVVMHLNANLFNEIFATHPDSKIIQTALLCLLAITLLYFQRDFFFNNNKREPINRPVLS
jgi:uncharacterized protein